MQCIFCEEVFQIQRNVINNGGKREIEKLKKHLLVKHRFIISDIYEIVNLDEYINYWRDLFQRKGSIENYCAVTFTCVENQRKSETYQMLCPDLIPMDKELRQRLLNNVPKREIVPLKEVVIAGPPKHFKKQELCAKENKSDNDFNGVKTADPCVRNKDERKLLNGHGCSECFDYYSSLNLTAEQLKGRLDKCSRHRAQYSPPRTPPEFWDIRIPSTPECVKNGWLSSNS